MKKISVKAVFKQLKYDLVGKDSYRGVTLTYSWLANQFGHFGLGFIPACIVYRLLVYWQYTHAACKASVGVWVCWILFETYNCIEPIVSRKTKTNVFPAPWSNIIYDVLTDLSFFGIGAFAGGFVSDHQDGQLLIFVLILAVVVLYPSWDWYRTKMYQQEAGYPFQFRLNQWASACTEENKNRILAFMKDDGAGGKHLFVFGPYKSGKTSLSVAIANECSITHHTCKYVTAIKLFNLFFEQPDADALWDWRESSLLVIDDINPASPLKEEVVTPSSFLRFMDQDGMGEANKEVIRNKNIIWVLGVEEDEERSKHKKWTHMLTELGIAGDKIYAVNLG